MKKIIHYMQEQAVHPSPSSTYLSPGGKEPQQRVQHHHHQQHQNHNYDHHSSQPSPKFYVKPEEPQFRSQSPPTPYPLPPDIVRHQYASDNILQSYSVYIPPPPILNSYADKYFLIFIHGGYYRDPKISATAFNPTLSLLTHPSSPLNQASHESLRISDHISGAASINYRLSPHPAYPQDPTKTSNYELRQAKHPDHIHDVLTAIHDLQRRYKFGSKYILIGHSVGATLALQAVLGLSVPWSPPEIQPPATTGGGSSSSSNDTVNHHNNDELHTDDRHRRFSTSTSHTLVEPHLRITPPTTILALNGIFSFPLLHQAHPEYETMTRHALFPTTTSSTTPIVDEEKYLPLSPAHFSPEDFPATLKFLVLASSRSDLLVPWNQVEAMHTVFSTSSSSSTSADQKKKNSSSSNSSTSSITSTDPTTAANRHAATGNKVRCEIIELQKSPSHDESWKSGHEVARIVKDVISYLVLECNPEV